MGLRLSLFTAPGDWSFLTDVPGWSRNQGILQNGLSTMLDGQSGLFSMWEADINRDEIDYNMNHIAYSANAVDLIKGAFRTHPGHLFYDGTGWDPLVDQNIRTVHFYDPGRFYVTLRESNEPFSAHHVGWECLSRESVDAVEPILRRHNFSIVWKGNIDGSYVLHFQGPDKRVHDFFYVNKSVAGLPKL